MDSGHFERVLATPACFVAAVLTSMMLLCAAISCAPPRRTRRPALRSARACAAPSELLILDFESGLSAGGKTLHARGLAAALSFTALPYYVLSDASPDTVAAVFRDAAGVELAPPRVFPRSLAGLRAVAARPLAAAAPRVRLVSGDAALLAAAAAEPATAAWALHAAAWLPDASAPQSGDRIKPLPLDALVELLNFGLLVGVGDGCQEKFDAQGRELESN